MNGLSRIRLAAWFQIAVGLGIIGWWTVAAASNGIPELEEGRIDIGFHIAAELLTAIALLTAGRMLLTDGRTLRSAALSGLALGALLYSTVNSPGYFADRGEWWAVAMFAAIGVAAAGSAVTLMRPDAAARGGPTAAHSSRQAVRSEAMTRRRDDLQSVDQPGGTP